MRIVLLSYLHGFGGAEKQSIMLANAMAERGHDITLIAICAANMCYDLNDKVKFIFLPDQRTNVLRIVYRYFDIKKKLEEIRPDVTINFWFQSAYMTALMNKSITGKVIYSERGDPGDKEYSGMLGLIRKMTMPRIDGFVFQTNSAKEYFDKKIQSRSVIIPNPVFVGREDYPEIKKRRKVIVTVGRLHPQKNQKLLIDSFALIADRIPDYSLEIYGEGELKDALKKHIEELGLTERVFLKGTNSRILSFICDATLFVLSSDYEGQPNTLLEAMALGIPCITTDWRPGGAKEILGTDIDDVIVPPGDQKRLADCIMTKLNNYDKALELAKLIKRSMISNEPSRVYDAWGTYLNDVCERK